MQLAFSIISPCSRGNAASKRARVLDYQDKYTLMNWWYIINSLSEKICLQCISVRFAICMRFLYLFMICASAARVNVLNIHRCAAWDWLQAAFGSTKAYCLHRRVDALQSAVNQHLITMRFGFFFSSFCSCKCSAIFEMTTKQMMYGYGFYMAKWICFARSHCRCASKSISIRTHIFYRIELMNIVRGNSRCKIILMMCWNRYYWWWTPFVKTSGWNCICILQQPYAPFFAYYNLITVHCTQWIAQSLLWIKWNQSRWKSLCSTLAASSLYT